MQNVQHTNKYGLVDWAVQRRCLQTADKRRDNAHEQEITNRNIATETSTRRSGVATNPRCKTRKSRKTQQDNSRHSIYCTVNRGTASITLQN